MTNNGFKVDLDEAEKAATGSLPSAVQRLLGPIGTLRTHEGFNGPGSFDAVDRFTSSYAGWSDAQARRLQRGSEVMEANAVALREIIAVYRRVDGRI
nr:hypothetical protein [Kibdelosporangium sp. MJ126-NF4]CEL16140.1 hypothetical protein [Kibdelosporangium sp. MJ126-NF4]CTQ94066.1 hypothetical protein [Kibdelosporangium sp. MJ126-NF4]